MELAACGSGGSGGRDYCKGEYSYKDPSEQLGVRCCVYNETRPERVVGPDGITWNHGNSDWDGWSTYCEADNIYGESVEVGGSCLRADYDTAVETCNELGYRLCTVQELSDNCASWSGCGFDAEMVWAAEDR